VTRLVRLGCFALLAVLPMSSGALPWNQDMVDQPSVKAQEKRVNEPRDAVPVTGGEPLAKPQTPTEVVAGRLQAASIANPQAVTPESLARGKALYETHCLPCHGAEGHGDGPVGKKYTPTPMNLTFDYVQQQADGQLYYTITRGGIVMPFYRDAIAPADRWNVVNYIKHALVHP
jgi:mono/diheme cytochrome c family protein